MRMRQIIPQQTNQYQHGYQISGQDLSQQQLSGAFQHTFIQQHNTMNQLNGQGVFRTNNNTAPATSPG